MSKTHEKYFKGYDVPKYFRKRAIAIMTRFNIWGLCDGMYIANILAFWSGSGDGESHFYEVKGFTNGSLGLMKAAEEIVGAYGWNIKSDDLSTVKEILETGYIDRPEAIEGLTQMVSRIINEKAAAKADNDDWRVEYLNRNLAKIGMTLKELKAA